MAACYDTGIDEATAPYACNTQTAFIYISYSMLPTGEY